jgi:hypothetical protein
MRALTPPPAPRAHPPCAPQVALSAPLQLLIIGLEAGFGMHGSTARMVMVAVLLVRGLRLMRLLALQRSSFFGKPGFRCGGRGWVGGGWVGGWGGGGGDACNSIARNVHESTAGHPPPPPPPLRHPCLCLVLRPPFPPPQVLKRRGSLVLH